MPDVLPFTCANCRREIGRLEQSRAWGDQAVCPACHGRLLGSDPSALGYATAAPRGWRAVLAWPARRWAMLGAAVVLLAGIGAGAWWWTRPEPVRASDIVWFHADNEAVYALPGSDLYHFGNCPNFSPEMSTAGTVQKVRAAYAHPELRRRLCPRCTFPLIDATTGEVQFATRQP